MKNLINEHLYLEEPLVFGCIESQNGQELFVNGFHVDSDKHIKILEELDYPDHPDFQTIFNHNLLRDETTRGNRSGMPFRIDVFCRHYPAFQELNYQVKQFDKIQNEKYIYPIQLFTYIIEQLIQRPDIVYIPNKVIKDVQQNQAKILFFDWHEGFSRNETHIIPFLQSFADYYGLPESNIGFQDNNFSTPELHQSTPFRGFTYNYFESELAPREAFQRLVRIRQGDFSDIKDRFICLNRKANSHRDIITSYFWQRPDLNVAWSYMKVDDYHQRHTPDITVSGKKYSVTNAYSNSMPHYLDLHDKSTNMDAVVLNYDTIKSAAINLVTETYCDNRTTTFFSEKIYKPLCAGQPFMLFGDINSLQYLRNQGYKTYSEIFNETYDRDINYERRIEKVLEETERLNKLPKHKFNRIIASVADISLHNMLNTNRRVGGVVNQKQYLHTLQGWLNE